MRKSAAVTMKLLALSMFCLVILAACGRKEDGQPEGGQFSGEGGGQLDVVLDENDFPDVSAELKGGSFLGMQFYKGEPVQLWASGEGDTVSVYLYRKDGTRDTVLETISRDKTRSGGYLDEQGNYYGIADNMVTKTDASGQELFSAVAGDAGRYDSIEEVCSSPDGKTVLLANITNPETSYIEMILMELGQGGELKEVELKDAGKASDEKSLSLMAHLGTWGEDLLLMEGDYIYKIDLQAGTLTQAVSLMQTSYVSQQYRPQSSQEDISAVYIPEEGRIELLWAYSSGRGRCENLTFKDMTKERETITLKGLNVEPWLKEQVAKFNSTNDRYYISISTRGMESGAYEFRINTGIEIATGKGPELLYGELMLTESLSSMMEKGMLVNLAPLMEQAGIREEDYFPMTFRWRTEDAIYGIYYKAAAEDCLIRADVLGDMRDPDMEPLLDALLAYPEQACLGGGGSSSKNVLRDLLYASETLYGMLDWEAGTCDFSGELLPKMLEVAKRYKYLSTEKDITKRRSNYQNYIFHTEEDYEAEGYVPCYYIFDDGPHPAVNRYQDRLLYINANSAHPEAAWEFLSFILSEEAQKTIYTGDYHDDLPVMKKLFLSGGQDFLENGWAGGAKPYIGYEVTQERLDALTEFLEDARELPWKTEPIIEIIVEEAVGYFNGFKDIQQVQNMVQNRVQLYMDERGGNG